MAAYEVLLLNTAIPQIQAAQSGDTYVVPRDIAFSAALTLSAGTANGVPYLNASKVLTSGSALTFNGSTLATSSANASFTSGSATTAGVITSGAAGSQGVIQFGSSQTTFNIQGGPDYLGMIYNAASALSHQWAIGGSEQMRLTSTGLGIGTNNPGSKLHVDGAAGSGGGDVAIRLRDSTSTNTLQMIRTGATYSYAGIGSNEGALYSANTLTLCADSSSVIKFAAGGSERARITSGGNFGIGTTNPDEKLVVASTSAAGYVTSCFDNTATNGYSRLRLRIGATGGSGTADISYSPGTFFAIGPTENDTTTPIVFRTNNGTERARITSGGIFQVSSGGSVQVGGTAARATTAGTNRLDIFNGTAPVGTLTNGISIYSSSGEAYVMDAAGNATLFSPHDAETNEWIFKSKHTPTGKVLKIDVERLLKFVNDHFGLDAVHEFVEE